VKGKLWAVLAVMVVFSLGLAACGPTPTPVPTDTPTPVPTDTPTPVPTDTPTPVPPTDTPTHTPTPRPTSTPTHTPTPVPDAVVSVEAGNLRAGPGTEYDIIGKVKKGDSVTVSTKNSAGDWVKVEVSGQIGWLSVSLLELNISLSSVSVEANIPPTPTPAFTPTPTLTPTPKVCPPNPALVQVRNYLDVTVTYKLSGPENVTIRAPKGNTNVCIKPGTYSSVTSAPGYQSMFDTDTFDTYACTCMDFFPTSMISTPPCLCPDDPASYHRP
jgi:hypothetical protein